MSKFDIKSFNPCPEAVEFYKDLESFEEAWSNCHRGDWMLWISSIIKADIRLLTLTKGRCAETVIHLMKDERSIKGVHAAIDFGMMEIDIDELKTVAADAADASYASYADAAAYAAAAYAAYAAAAYAAAADAAYAADASYADAAYARKQNQQKTADICREFLTNEVMNKINNYG